MTPVIDKLSEILVESPELSSPSSFPKALTGESSLNSEQRQLAEKLNEAFYMVFHP